MRNALLVCALFASVPLYASTESIVDIDSRARKSAAIVVATVTEVEAGRFDVNPFGDRLIVTRAWLRVEEVVKGRPQQVIALDLEGGTVGDLTLQVSDMPAMRRGERAVLFLDAGRNGAFAPNGRGQGVLKLAGERVSNSSLTLADLKTRIRAALR